MIAIETAGLERRLEIGAIEQAEPQAVEDRQPGRIFGEGFRRGAVGIAQLGIDDRTSAPGLGKVARVEVLPFHQKVG